MPIESSTASINPAQGLYIDGGHSLAADQVEELTKFAIDSIARHSYGNEGDEDIENLKRGEDKVFVRKKIINALGRNGTLLGIENTPDQVDAIAQKEDQALQLIEDSIRNGYMSVINVPIAYRAVVGEEQFITDLEATAMSNPTGIILNLKALTSATEPELLNKILVTAYDSLQKDENQKFKAFLLNEGLIDAVGRERLEADIKVAIENGEMFGKNPDSSDVAKVAALGFLTPENAIEMLLPSIPAESYFRGRDLSTIAELSDNPEELWAKARKTALKTVSDPSTSLEVAEGILKYFTSSYNQNYTKQFAEQVVSAVQQNYGITALLPVHSSLSEIFGAEFAENVISSALESLDSEVDPTKKATIARSLLYNSDKFDAATVKRLTTELAKADPTGFISFRSVWPNENKSAEENEFLRSTLTSVIDRLSPKDIGRALSELRAWYPEGDSRFDQLVVPRLIEAEDAYWIRADQIKEFLNTEQATALFLGIMERIDLDEGYSMQTVFSKAMEYFGIEEAKQLFADKIQNSPTFALSLIQKNQRMFDNQYLEDLIRITVQGGRVNGLLFELGHIASRLEKGKLIGLLDVAVDEAPKGLLKQFNSLANVVDASDLRAIALKVLSKNPAVVLSSLGTLTELSISNIEEVVSYMAQDPRTAFAPKYFNKIIRRLPKTEATSAFQIMAKEAELVYSKINRITQLDSNEGSAMIHRIRESVGSSDERSELESISLATIAVIARADISAIKTAEDAKIVAVSFLNERLGLRIATTGDAAAKLEERMGSLIPVSMYLLTASDKNLKYLSEIVGAVAKDKFTEWKYGDFDQLVNVGILPRMEQEAFNHWKATSVSESAEVAADDAVSVANKIREVVGRGLLLYPTIQKLANTGEPIAMISSIKAEAGQVGKSIAAINRQKAAGELSESEAISQVAELQEKMVQLELATNIIRLSKTTPEEVASGYLFNEKGRPTKATIEGILSQIADQYGDEALEAFGQIETMLENYKDATTTDIGGITVADIDDFQTTMEIGANPVGSCQHYELGQYREGLLGYFEPGVKIIAVRNEKGKLVARAATRLASNPDGSASMVLEPTYMSQASDDIEKAIVDHAKAKAKSMGLALYAKNEGGRKDILIQGHRAPAIYSDVFGGIHAREDEPATSHGGLTML